MTLDGTLVLYGPVFDLMNLYLLHMRHLLEVFVCVSTHYETASYKYYPYLVVLFSYNVPQKKKKKKKNENRFTNKNLTSKNIFE